MKINSECSYVGLKNYKCKECRKECKRPIDELKEKVPNIYQFCYDELNKFFLSLRKGVYPYEYMDSWEKFNETALPPKKEFYSNLNLEDISDEDYKHVQKVWDIFEIENLGEYHDLNDTLKTIKMIHYYFQIYLKILERCVLVYMNLILYILYLHRD